MAPSIAEILVTLRSLDNSERKATARRWAKRNGFAGAQGGWIYTATHKPVCQGWYSFFDHFRHRIVADVAAGHFTVSHRRSKP